MANPERYAFNKILTVRQILGRATLGLHSGQAETLKARDEVTRELTDLLQLLSPNSDVDSLQAFVQNVVDKSISLRNLMTEEQAIYRPYWIRGGVSCDPEWIQLAYGDKPESTVVMCTFPGLRRFLMSDNRIDFIPVVKATAVLKGR